MKSISKFLFINKVVLNRYETVGGFDCPLLLVGLCQSGDLPSPRTPIYTWL